MIEELIENDEFVEYQINLIRKIKTISNEDERDFLLRYLKQTKKLYYESREFAQKYLLGVDEKTLIVFEKVEDFIKAYHEK